MNRDEQKVIVDGVDEKCKAIMFSKSQDYANEDILSNFKRVSEATRVLNIDIHTPYGYAMFMTLMKIDRINNLLMESKTPKNESIDDSFIDGINYFKLAYCCLKESPKYAVWQKS